MTIINVSLDKLTRWNGNPRKTVPIRHELKASLAAKGLLQPMIGRPTNGEEIEIIAGGNRLDLIIELSAEGAWPADRPIHVDVREELKGDDSAALDVAISENIMMPMHPIEQFEAFSKLLNENPNITIKDVANSYGVTPRVVEQRLSYAKLDEEARDLVRENKRDLAWASAMTLASPDEQKTILSEIETDPKRFRHAHEVHTRVRDDLVPVSYALFDIEKAKDLLVRRDLFDDQDGAYISLSDFMPLQDEAVQARGEDLEAEGWSKVQILSDRDFDLYQYNDGVTDKSIGEAILVRYPTGQVVEHIGLSLRDTERLSKIDNADEDAGERLFGDDADEIDLSSNDNEDIDPDNPFGEAPKALKESNATRKYLEISRSVIVQHAMVQNPKLAIVATIAGMIGASAPRPVQGALSRDLPRISPDAFARVQVEEKNEIVRNIKEKAGIDPHGDYADNYAKLAALDDADLNLLLASEISKRVASDMPQSEALFRATLTASQQAASQYWQIDRGYLETLSREAIQALADQILPARFQTKLGRGKSDMIETFIQLVDSARGQDGRLREDEAETLLGWSPAILQIDGDEASPFDTISHDATDVEQVSTETDERDGELFAA